MPKKEIAYVSDWSSMYAHYLWLFCCWVFQLYQKGQKYEKRSRWRVFTMLSEKKFQRKNSNRSKQTTAKGKQIENQGYGLRYGSK